MDDDVAKAKAELKAAEAKYCKSVNECSILSKQASSALTSLCKCQRNSEQLFEKVVVCRQELRRLTCVGPNNLEGIYT